MVNIWDYTYSFLHDLWMLTTYTYIPYRMIYNREAQLYNINTYF